MLINPKVRDKYSFEAFCKWMGITNPNENSRALYNSGDVSGRFIEQVIIQNEGIKQTIKENQNTHFYDILRYKNNVIMKGEIKTTSTLVTDASMKKHNTSYLKIGGFAQKINEFDEIIIIDKVNFHRFEIPHDIFFSKAIFSGTKGNDFRWYADYDEYKTLQKVKRNLLSDGTHRLRSKALANNTKLIKKYQILD